MTEIFTINNSHKFCFCVLTYTLSRNPWLSFSVPSDFNALSKFEPLPWMVNKLLEIVSLSYKMKRTKNVLNEWLTLMLLDVIT